MGTDDRAAVPQGGITSGHVEVRVHCAAPLPRVWAAITEPAHVEQWFGYLAGPLRVGEENRVDFGDGDFFVLVPRRIEPPELDFDWRFLGVARQELITWRLAPTADGVSVTVRDHDDRRSPAEAAEMLEGWTDFLSRLERHLRTGKNTRYGWRDDIDGSVELPAGDFHPLRESELYEWLPIASDGFEPSWFFVLDEEGPRRFRIRDWDLTPDRLLTFTVEIPDSQHNPACTVRLREAAGGTWKLSFAHTGWTRLGWSAQRAQSVRRRFAATWIAALSSARAHAG
ncbi:SRPBCC domain-containing protein [Saccharopolyspora sp. NPDC050642]|uniref:SRPBCC family protein n=1 Tax=Saccharopolyspora sp. NPDC050642 TaxID=3157099 RepID=UPI0034102D73